MAINHEGRLKVCQGMVMALAQAVYNEEKGPEK